MDSNQEMEDHIAKVVSEAPPLTEQQKARLTALLNHSEVHAHDD